MSLKVRKNPDKHTVKDIMRQIKENTQFTNYANNLKHDLLHWVVINGDNENGLNHFMDIIDCFTKMNNINYKIKE